MHLDLQDPINSPGICQAEWLRDLDSMFRRFRRTAHVATYLKSRSSAGKQT